MLKEANVPLLAGTDSPASGTAHGVGIHRELELLVKAGLTPTEALKAATSTPAKIFSLKDRGRIAVGLRADLLLVKGNPTNGITMTRDIVAVWKAGVPVNRVPIEKPSVPAITAVELESGLASNFDDGKIKSCFGSGWQISTDTIMGGQSTAEINVVEGGAEDSAGSLQIKGKIIPGAYFPWAGAIFFPGNKPMEPVDLSRFKKITFWAKGEAKTYRIMIFADKFGYIPIQKTFFAGPDWKSYTFSFTNFSQFDGKGIKGVFFAGGPEKGDFTLLIDNLEFQ